MGSAPSQYFQGDGAKPRAQSHNLSYNSTGWVASAVLVNTLFHSVCFLIRHPPIQLSRDLFFSPHPNFVLTCLYSLFFYSFKIFSSHLPVGTPSKFQPGTHVHHLTFPLTHLIPLSMVGHSQSVFQGWNRATINWCNLTLCSICVRIWFIVFHWSDFIDIYCFVYNYPFFYCSVLGVIINWFQPFKSTQEMKQHSW